MDQLARPRLNLTYYGLTILPNVSPKRTRTVPLGININLLFISPILLLSELGVIFVFLFCTGGNTAPCGSYVGYEKMENIWSLVVLVRLQFTVYD